MVMHIQFCQDFLGIRGVINCPLAFKMSLDFSVLSHKLASNSSKKEFSTFLVRLKLLQD